MTQPIGVLIAGGLGAAGLAISFLSRYDLRRPRPAMSLELVNEQSGDRSTGECIRVHLFNVSDIDIAIVDIGILHPHDSGYTVVRASVDGAEDTKYSYGPVTPCILPAHGILSWGIERTELARVRGMGTDILITVKWWGRSRLLWKLKPSRQSLDSSFAVRLDNGILRPAKDLDAGSTDAATTPDM